MGNWLKSEFVILRMGVNSSALYKQRGILARGSGTKLQTINTTYQNLRVILHTPTKQKASLCMKVMSVLMLLPPSFIAFIPFEDLL